jgi:hypothetical protein
MSIMADGPTGERTRYASRIPLKVDPAELPSLTMVPSGPAGVVPLPVLALPPGVGVGVDPASADTDAAEWWYAAGTAALQASLCYDERGKIPARPGQPCPARNPEPVEVHPREKGRYELVVSPGASAADLAAAAATLPHAVFLDHRRAAPRDPATVLTFQAIPGGPADPDGPAEAPAPPRAGGRPPSVPEHVPTSAPGARVGRLRGRQCACHLCRPRFARGVPAPLASLRARAQAPRRLRRPAGRVAEAAHPTARNR